ncbi:VENN motif pre-toxin domain-containing protein [Nonomuraea fuscirosea]|uniref:VENN motif pre-toxin domain-containing protein n=1 Tax=Nonomuraea fuscirosea TaxID=1291556 RepID=UPI0011B1E30C
MMWAVDLVREVVRALSTLVGGLAGGVCSDVSAAVVAAVRSRRGGVVRRAAFELSGGYVGRAVAGSRAEHHRAGPAGERAALRVRAAVGRGGGLGGAAGRCGGGGAG